MENNQVMIHVRFAPNGAVTEISECPAGASPQKWFDHLSRSTANCYASLSGGRGLYRVSREQVESLKGSCTQ
jgi:hypothetical protein